MDQIESRQRESRMRVSSCAAMSTRTYDQHEQNGGRVQCDQRCPEAL